MTRSQACRRSSRTTSSGSAAARRRLTDFAFLADQEAFEQDQWQPPLLVAASIYAASSLARVVVMDGLFVLALAAAVLALNAIG